MTFDKTTSSMDRIKEASTPTPAGTVWLTAFLVGLSAAWPLVYAVLFYGPRILIRALTGDSYHYLAIARKAHLAHIYTYDGIHVTNGFHPLWQYTLRALFWALNLQSHESQAIASIATALLALTLGIIFASVAVVRITNRPILAAALVPGLYYLIAGVHVRNLSIWAALDGMESAFSILFGGIFFYLISRAMASQADFDPVESYRAIGLLLPLLVLSRLDDVFVIPALLLALMIFEPAGKARTKSAIWVAAPTTLAIALYLIYNKLTVGAAMPLSGATKSGFAGFLSLYLTSAIHFAPILDLKSKLMHKSADGAAIFSNSFRMVELVYPLIGGIFGALAIRKYRKENREFSLLFATCIYVVYKMGYNFINVHPWHQADWYYAFAILSLSVLGAVALKYPWDALCRYPIARNGFVLVYGMLMLLCASQFYAEIVYQPKEPAVDLFWQRKSEIRAALVSHGVHGIINVDDGISAFLLDMPTMHGFAFATDVEAQRAHRKGAMLSLAYARGINTITGFGYLASDTPPSTDAEIRSFLKDGLAWNCMSSEMDQFNFSLAYYDPVLKMPFISFQPK